VLILHAAFRDWQPETGHHVNDAHAGASRKAGHALFMMNRQ
jgi:hypothetical protein